jgi:transcriptional regulator
MYTSPNFQAQSIHQVEDFLMKNGFAIVVSQQDGIPMATHIPLFLTTKPNGERVFSGHFAKANPQWHTIFEQKQVLAIFSGAHTYISSSWYDHVNVSTWNYIAVHIYGKMRLIEGDELLQSLKDLTDKYELHGTTPSKNPMRVEDMPEKYVHREMRGIVGFEMSIDTIQATFKLSQNRNDVSHTNIIEQLEARNEGDDVKIAAAMKCSRPKN